MAKICKKDGCNNPVFSTGFCRSHQHLRTDEKYLKSIARKKGNFNSESKKPYGFIHNKIGETNFYSKPCPKFKSKPNRKPTGEGKLFDELFVSRPPISFISGQNIIKIDGKIDYWNCAHVLAKGKNKFYHFKLESRNIVFLTRREHDLYDYGTKEQRQAYVEEMELRGIVVDWNKLYALAIQLKFEYLMKYDADYKRRISIISPTKPIDSSFICGTDDQSKS